MSITGLADHKKPSHRRNDSDELDVFEAARYFSGYNDNNYALMAQKVVHKEESKRGYMREGRVSLDVPSLKHYYYHQNKLRNPLAETQQHLQQQHQQLQQQQQQQQKTKEKKKYKQPSSPGGKIAQFLNSLFNQTNSKKKKSLKSSSTTTTTTQSMKDDDESPIGRRKRRSSISHFRSTSSAIDVRSIYSTSSSGFRTPPHNLNTPSKSCKDFKSSYPDYKDVLATLSKYSIQANDTSNKDEKHIIRGSSNNSHSNSNYNFDWIDDKLRLKNGVVEKSKSYNNHGFQEKKKSELIKHDDHDHKHDDYDDDDDGAYSDSSSDLFELQLDYDFGFCSSGLPVYETTHMDNIKRPPSSTAITNGPIKA